MIKTLKILFTALLTITASLCFSQTDKDVRIKDVPVIIKNYIKQTYPDAEKVKYYKEMEGDTLLYQATFRFKSDRYNLLFFTDGRIYETEIVMEYDELPEAVRENIKKDLTARYLKYTIRMVEQVNPQQAGKYELKVHARKANHSGYFEVFYDREGKFIEEEEEVLKSMPSNSGF